LMCIIASVSAAMISCRRCQGAAFINPQGSESTNETQSWIYYFGMKTAW
jgi:hypothetical protein